MKAYAEQPMKTTVKHKIPKGKLQHVQIEPAENGFTVHTRHHNDYMEPNGSPKPTVYQKKHGHEMLKHVAKKLGIKAHIRAMTDKESAAEDAGERGEE